jgi:hypothetical protein
MISATRARIALGPPPRNIVPPAKLVGEQLALGQELLKKCREQQDATIGSWTLTALLFPVRHSAAPMG